MLISAKRPRKLLMLLLPDNDRASTIETCALAKMPMASKQGKIRFMKILYIGQKQKAILSDSFLFI